MTVPQTRLVALLWQSISVYVFTESKTCPGMVIVVERQSITSMLQGCLFLLYTEDKAHLVLSSRLHCACIP